MFRERPDLLLGLLRDELLAVAPLYDRVEDKSNDLSNLVPVALRADLVLVFYQGQRVVMVLVLEVQRAPDVDKLTSWPGYVGELVHRYRCPVYLVVAAGEETTARWAAEPNPYFQPNSPFLPLVLGPQEIPVVVSEHEAARAPELALLSLSVHASGPQGDDVATAVMRVAERAGAEYKIMVMALLQQLLDETRRHLIEARLGMNLQEWFRNNENDAIRQSFQRGETRGETRGEAKAVLKVLAARGLVVSVQERERILACEHAPTLDRWLQLALTVTATSDLLSG